MCIRDSTQVDTEHLLLALIEQPDGVIPEILQRMGVDLEAITRRLDEELKRSPRTQIYGGGVGQVYITPRLKRIIDQSNDEASRLKDDYISVSYTHLRAHETPEHLVCRLLLEKKKQNTQPHIPLHQLHTQH